jgi:hypothetical protein
VFLGQLCGYCRPPFDVVVKELEEIIIEQCITDERGRDVWKKSCKGEDKMTWDKLARAVCISVGKVALPESYRSDRQMQCLKVRLSLSLSCTFSGSCVVTAMTTSHSQIPTLLTYCACCFQICRCCSVGNRSPTQCTRRSLERCWHGSVRTLTVGTRRAEAAHSSTAYVSSLARPTDTSPRVTFSTHAHTIPSPVPRARRAYAQIEETLSMKWFHGELSTQDAEERLDNRRPGTFLVRFSSSEKGAFTVSGVDKDRKKSHQRVVYHPNKGKTAFIVPLPAHSALSSDQRCRVLCACAVVQGSMSCLTIPSTRR